MNPGEVIGPYELVERDDDAGRTWRAVDKNGLHVQVDVTPHDDDPADSLDDDLAVARLLKHPNLVRFLDAGVRLDQRWVSIEMVEGLRLPQLVEGLRRQGKKVPPSIVGYIMQGLASAVKYVQGFVGPEGRPVGAVGRPLDAPSVIVTRTGGVKLATLPRAQKRALIEAQRRDLYGLGAISWELLADRPMPDDPAELQRWSTHLGLPDDVPDTLVTAIGQCLSMDVVDPPIDLDQLIAQLALVLGSAESLPEDEARRLVAEARASLRPPRAATAQLAGEPVVEQSEPSGERVGFGPRFEILERLGAGGMSEVYRVKDLELQEVVALKVLSSETGTVDKKLLERLRREVRLARRIASENVCRIFDIIDLGGGARGLTMALVEGDTLAALMKDSLAVDYARFARWGADIASGLAAAHELSIIHRDLKPQNVMVRHRDDRAVILDFGIATVHTDDDVRLTQPGHLIGTPLYMSPEQLVTGPLDGRSDLYALGLILFQLVTGRLPHASEHYVELLKRRAFEPVPIDVRAERPGTPDSLASMIELLLQPSVNDRPRDAREVSEQLLLIAGELSDPYIASPSRDGIARLRHRGEDRPRRRNRCRPNPYRGGRHRPASLRHDRRVMTGCQSQKRCSDW